jgi:type VI secretion system protein VasI
LLEYRSPDAGGGMHIRLLLFLPSLIAAHLIGGVASAQAQDDPKACAAITLDAKRLECFDLIFKKSSATSSVPQSDWSITQEKSKIDDTTNVFASLGSVQPIRNQYGAPANLDLMIVCREKKTDLYITFGGEFMASIENYGQVTFRVDKRPAFQKNLTESTDHKALGLWGANAIPFIKGLYGGSTLFVRATPYNESAVTGEFNISGVQDALNRCAKRVDGQANDSNSPA